MLQFLVSIFRSNKRSTKQFFVDKGFLQRFFTKKNWDQNINFADFQTMKLQSLVIVIKKKLKKKKN